MPRSPSHEALDLLIADHRRLQRLFVQFDKEEDDAEKEAIVRVACNELTIHTVLEEELFYPAVQDEIKDPDLVDEALVEHAAARHLMAQLDAMTADDAMFEATFKVLGEYVNHHFREEEETLFAEVRRTRIDQLEMTAAIVDRRQELREAMADEEPAEL